MIDSGISGFYRMSMDGRLRTLFELGVIDAETVRRIKHSKGLLSPEIADRMVENVIGVFGLPFAVAPNFLVNGRNHVVPMVVEEPSVVAAVSSAAKLVRDAGGFTVTSTKPVLTGQIHLCGVADAGAVVATLKSAEQHLIASANALLPRLVARGGGVVGLEFRELMLQGGDRTVVMHLLVDTCDAMGANTVNAMCEGIAAEVERLSGANAVLKILSNLADRSMITASATIPLQSLGAAGSELRDRIVLANDIANVDPYRAATHNKGVMNGMDAVAIATGNDWRALEAGAHAYAVRDGAYRALTKWSVNGEGSLEGILKLPVRVGIVGGSLRANPSAVAGLCISGAGSSQELGEIMTAVGLAQNFAALKALSSDGIQKGHMRLHARSVAMAAGVPNELSDQVVGALLESGEIKEWKAKHLLAELMSPRLSTPHKARGSGHAAGKVILLGEHAVVYGRPALALPINNAIRAAVYDTDSGIQLRIPAWGIEQSIQPDAPVTDGATALLQFVMRRLAPAADGLLVQVDSRIPLAVGLGSSAALAVALIRSMNDAFDLNLNDKMTNELAFDCEKLAHGTPSGIDNTLAVYGQPVLFQKDRTEQFRKLVLLEDPPLVIASSGQRGITREQVAGVRDRRQINMESYDRIFDEMGRISREGADALTARNYARLGALMNVCHGLLNALEVTTPLIEEMIDVARSNGAVGAKLTGAGGGGCVVALCPGKKNEVSDALRHAGFETLDGTAGPDDE